MSSQQEDRPRDVISSQAAEFQRAALVDLDAETSSLHALGAWGRGKSAKRLTQFPNFRVNLIALKAGSSLGEHHNPGRVSIQPVSGHIRVRAEGAWLDVPVGKLVVLDRDVLHDVEALEESAFLVTVAFDDVSARS